MNRCLRARSVATREAIAAIGLTILLVTSVTGCANRGQVTRSNDDVNICRQFIAEAGNTMQALNHDTFHPQDLTFRQLQVLTANDRGFLGADFLVLNQNWKFEKGGKKIVIICAKCRVEEHGNRRYFVAYNSGDYGWLSEEKVSNLHWADYSVLPKVR